MRLLPTLLSYKAGRLENWRAKEAVLRHYLKHWPQARLEDAARTFVAHRLERF